MLPTGQSNARAFYRIGSGSAGNVAANSLTTLADRPLGVSGVTNPQAATGGQDPQSIDDVRTNAPQTVLTLGRRFRLRTTRISRIRSPKSQRPTRSGFPRPNRGVFLTVAGTAGAACRGATSRSAIWSSAAELRQSADPDHRANLCRDAFHLLGQRGVRPEIRPADGSGEHVQETLSQAFGFAAHRSASPSRSMRSPRSFRAWRASSPATSSG